MKISLLISTYNWSQALDLVLSSVLRQTRMPEEILIADDGSDQRTKALIESTGDRTKVPIRHLWHEDNGYRKTTIVNRAIASAVGDYIVQIDGDVILHPRFIEDHGDFAAPKRFIRGYRIQLNETRTAKAISSKTIDFSIPAAGLSSSLKSLRIPVLSRIFRIDQQKCDRVYGCNLSFWRADALAVNGYNNDFTGWGNDDQEFAARLTHIGIKRRKIRFAAKQHHLHHPEASRERASKNKTLLQNTLINKLTYCHNGIIENYRP